MTNFQFHHQGYQVFHQSMAEKSYRCPRFILCLIYFFPNNTPTYYLKIKTFKQKFDDNPEAKIEFIALYHTALEVSVFGVILLRIFLHSDWIWRDTQFPLDLVTFTEEILNAKLHFYYSGKCGQEEAGRAKARSRTIIVP